MMKNVYEQYMTETKLENECFKEIQDKEWMTPQKKGGGLAKYVKRKRENLKSKTLKELKH